MKAQYRQIFSALSVITAIIPSFGNAQENSMTHQTASFIEMPAAEGQTQAFADFLSGAAELVQKTEPGTELWLALQNESGLAIFDIFVNESARDAHFSGVVAGALNENADTLVLGGWDAGVVANINNSNVLSLTSSIGLSSVTTATYIRLEAAPGKSEQLAALLTAAAPIVAETEPETLFWAALQIDANNFAIFDLFADQSGREAHFAGQVAGLLNDQSSELVVGGWDDGVVANISNFEVLSVASN